MHFLSIHTIIDDENKNNSMTIYIAGYFASRTQVNNYHIASV